MRRPVFARLLKSITGIVLVAACCSVACKRGHPPPGSKDKEGPPLVVKADTEGLLLTWIDDKGDFHIETRVSEVPLMGRDSVRVVDPNREDGSNADRVFVVDLRQTRPDGTYAVRAMARADFEALAVARREKAGPTLSNATIPAEPPSSPSAGAPDPGASSSATRSLVIIYGADWCGACHDAARYLRRRGVAFVEKNIEKDPAAAREMQDKLAKSGLRVGSIPVIDVRGRIMVGFNAAEIDGALGQAL
jgi:glutaredoxin